MNYLAIGALLILLGYAIAHITPVEDASVNTQITQTDLEMKATRLHNEVAQFYHYNRTNFGRTLSDQELRVQGGVCQHYANYYVARAQQMGITARYVFFNLNETENHAVAIISDSTGYCVLDQLVQRCVRVKI